MGVLSWVMVGAVVGAVLGLTGAGGAIVALPLLQFFTGMSIHDASVSVLPIVGVAALVSLFPQRRHVHLGLALRVLAFSIPVTYAMAWIKPFIPSVVITALILLFMVWAFVQTWRHVDSPLSTMPMSIGQSGFVVGTVAGVLTTMTGLGGGILLTPLLTRLTLLTALQIPATALVVIAGNSFLSFVIQGAPSTGLVLVDFVALGLGLFFANVVVMVAAKRCPQVCTRRLRKGVYMGVLCLAMALLLI